MRALCISNINYTGIRSLAIDYSQILNCVGCGIYIDSDNDRIIIKWKVSLPTNILRILDFVDDAFSDNITYDEQYIRKLKKTITILEDDRAVLFNSDSGDVEVIDYSKI